MGYNTKIDWCDSSWNPVTGCYHECEYCYARGIAERFGGYTSDGRGMRVSYCSDNGVYELNRPLMRSDGDGKRRLAPYPFGFTPTLHYYRLDQPSKWSEPRTIFVCSMADLFGEWVPDEWIEEVISACLAAPQHRYLFLTKNPKRYLQLIGSGVIPEGQQNFWFGSTTTRPEMEFFWSENVNTFVSIEPILAPFKNLTDKGVKAASKTKWIIVGAETGRRSEKVAPKKAWIDEIAAACKDAGIPLFMKESLRDVMGDDFRQGFPWEVR